MGNYKLSGHELDYLDDDWIKSIDDIAKLEFRLECELSGSLDLDSFKDAKRGIECLSKTVRKSYIDMAGRFMGNGEDSFKHGLSELSYTHFQTAVTIYARLNHHKKFSESLSRLALAKYGIDNDKEQACRMLSPIDSLVSHYLAKKYAGQGPGKNPFAVEGINKRRAKIKQKKKSGQLNAKERWPRRNWKDYHTRLQNLRTALNLVYIKADTYFRLGARQEFDAEYAKAFNILDERYPKDQDYKDSVMQRFDALRDTF